MPRKILALLVFASALVAGHALDAQTRLLRFPDISGDQVAFVYAGDIWTAPADGGLARRITSHPGVELFPHFSPDGAWIAFTGQYDGDEQVYVVPAEGGEPRQLTFFPARGPLPPRWGWDNQVYGWTADGTRILFRTLRDGWDLTDSRLYTVATEGGLPTALPMPVSGAGDLSPDGEKVFYSPLVRDFRTWKRYQGGWAQDLWIFDLATHAAQQITKDPRTDRDPMWIGDTLYFVSDRDGTLNLYATEPDQEAPRQLTHSTVWDVRWPGHDDRRIVYELGGELVVFDTNDGTERKISIDVPSDDLPRRPSWISVSDKIEDFELSPHAQRALFVARGDVFTAPIEKGPTRNLTQSPGAHDRWARWSPDGRQVAFISDLSGEDELYLVDQAGDSPPQQVTSGGEGMRYAPAWAPDGKRIAFSDKNGILYVVTLADKKMVEVAHDVQGSIHDYAWSPRGGHLAFSLSEPTGFRSIWIWSAADGQTRRVTGPQFNDFAPAWDPEGSYLYYLSDRELAPQIGSFEWNYLVDRETEVFALALRGEVGPPLPPESDEVKVAGGDETDRGEAEDKPAGKKDEATQKPYLKVGFDGLATRVARLPIEGDNYASLQATGKHLVLTVAGPFYYGRKSDRPPALKVFSFEGRELSPFVEGISGYAISRDGEKVLVSQQGSYKLYTLPPDGQKAPQAAEAKEVSTSGLQMWWVPEEEWREIFDEVWRRYRDFFYVPNMHGYDWKAIGDRYRQELPWVGHRSDLNYVLGEMVAELSTSHSYLEGGDFDIPERPEVALPGARFELDRQAGRYRIAKILPGDNREERYRSPLTEIGVDVSVGDYVLAIDGTPLTAEQNPYRLLRFKADHPVELTVSSQPTLEGSRKVTFRPRTSETELVYYQWTEKNRERLREATGGRVGYLHLPDMGEDGIREFIKWYYGQIRKQGLVVDVRSNGGGNVSQMLIERLSRKLLGVGFSRNSELPQTYPAQTFYGHQVCLLNSTSASDGDIFPHMFRQADLGPLIGERSWGGVVGITDHGPLIDGGEVFVPEFAEANLQGEWVIEGHGVDPDVVVRNDAESVIEGRDPQLERGIEEVLKAIEADPKALPPKPPAPVKTE